MEGLYAKTIDLRELPQFFEKSFKVPPKILSVVKLADIFQHSVF